jgi:hypothetical protein
MATYTRTAIQNYIWDSIIFSQVAGQIDVQSTINAGVKRVWTEVDLRSSKRLSSIIQLFDDVYDYFCPTDLKDEAICDIIPQLKRSPNFDPQLVGAAEFDQRKSFENNLIAFNDHDLIRKLRVSVVSDTLSFTISSLDSLTSGSQSTNWTALGDATNLRADLQNYVEGSGSLEYDIDNGGTTTAGVQNLSLNTFDLAAYEPLGSVFAYAYISQIATPADISNFTLVIYDNQGYTYTVAVTQTNEGAAFYQGWQLLNFSLQTGALSNANFNWASCTGIKLYMTKSTGKVNQTQFRFDIIMAAAGTFDNVLYYSKFPWLNYSTGAYQNESANAGDYIVCDDDELTLVISACRAEADRRLRDWNAYEIDNGQYQIDKENYILKVPSDRKMKTQTYYDLDSTLGLNTDLSAIVQEPDQLIDQEGD